MKVRSLTKVTEKEPSENEITSIGKRHVSGWVEASPVFVSMCVFVCACVRACL